jgi:hypothetical protein
MSSCRALAGAETGLLLRSDLIPAQGLNLLVVGQIEPHTLPLHFLGVPLMRLSVARARFVIVGYSLGMTGLLIVFFLIAPTFLPFNPGRSENIRLIEITLPVFLGCLASASHFLFRGTSSSSPFVGDENLLFLMVIGPCTLFFILIITLFSVFYFRQLVIDDLTKWYSMILSLLTSTIGITSANLFMTSSGDT